MLSIHQYEQLYRWRYPLGHLAEVVDHWERSIDTACSFSSLFLACDVDMPENLSASVWQQTLCELSWQHRRHSLVVHMNPCVWMCLCSLIACIGLADLWKARYITVSADSIAGAVIYNTHCRTVNLSLWKLQGIIQVGQSTLSMFTNSEKCDKLLYKALDTVHKW